MDKQDTSFFGRKKGRPLNQSRAEALDTLLPLLHLDEALLKEDASIEPCSLYKKTPDKIIFEIGFGNGERLAEHIRREPHVGFIGAEPFLNGMAAFLKSITPVPPDNIRVHMDDAMPLARSLKPASIDALYILNPDPWHKTRHHKRRIINPGNLDVFARILKPGGALIMSTDVPYLAEWMLTHALNHPAFAWTARGAQDWRTPPNGWIPTRYETKRAKGADKMAYLIFEKI